MRHLSILVGAITCMSACTAPTQTMHQPMTYIEKLHIAQRNQDAYMYCDKEGCLQRTTKTLRSVETTVDAGQLNVDVPVALSVTDTATLPEKSTAQKHITPTHHKKSLRKKNMKRKKKRFPQPNCTAKT